jgi:hypothetical protein
MVHVLTWFFMTEFMLTVDLQTYLQLLSLLIEKR